MGAAYIATRRAFGGQRPTVTWPVLASGAAAAGIGFTVSLLVASLAFTGADLDEAKIGVLATAIISPAIAWLVLQVVKRLPDEVRARQLGAVAGQLTDLADDVDPARDHVRGAAGAPVTLLEYGDFECPYCGNAEPTIVRLMERFGGELRYVWRHLPLSDVHPDAQLAAEASEAAAQQGKFWEMHDRLLAHQDQLSVSDLYRHAAAIELDLDRFSDSFTHRRAAPRIAQDVATADASGVTGTPTFFINGRRHQGVYDIDTLIKAVKAAHAAPRSAA
jgi:protein-disulfide isomerase